MVFKEGDHTKTEFKKGHPALGGFETRFKKGQKKIEGSGSFKIGNQLRKGKAAWNKGLTKENNEILNSISNKLKGKSFPEERRKNISKSKIGKPTWNKGIKCPQISKGEMGVPHLKLRGRKYSEEHRRKLGESKKGSKNPNWIEGKSYEPYGEEFNEQLRNKIRKRDNFTCQICNERGWVVHHIDYNKRNNNEENLITLCPSCHTKTTFKRAYYEWQLKILVLLFIIQKKDYLLNSKNCEVYIKYMRERKK